jgi:hypothetical protein
LLIPSDLAWGEALGRIQKEAQKDNKKGSYLIMTNGKARESDSVNPT